MDLTKIDGNNSFSQGMNRLKKHFLETNRKNGTGQGLEVTKDVNDTVQSTFGKFVKMLTEIRSGNYVDDRRKVKAAAIDLSLSNALMEFYGCTTEQWLKTMSINFKSDNLETAAKVLGCNNLGVANMEQFMIDHSSFNSAPNSTTQINDEFRFVIPELIAAAIRTGYEHTSQHQNWIASTMNMTNRKMKMPQILRGDGNPTVISEGADIPVGSIAFGQKEVNVFKVGTGFVITDELMQESSLDHMFIFLGEVGNDMAISTDQLALRILLNGEQADGSESAPVIGIDTLGNGLETVDLRRIKTRMNRLGNMLTRAVLSEDDSNLDMNRARPEREEIFIDEYMDVGFDNQTLPAGQSMYLAANRAMTKLQYGTMTTERRRNARNQTDEMFVSNHFGFAVLRRDARVILDNTLTFAANPFPAYMDIDARLQQAFSEY